MKNAAKYFDSYFKKWFDDFVLPESSSYLKLDVFYEHYMLWALKNAPLVAGKQRFLTLLKKSGVESDISILGQPIVKMRLKPKQP